VEAEGEGRRGPSDPLSLSLGNAFDGREGNVRVSNFPLKGSTSRDSGGKGEEKCRCVRRGTGNGLGRGRDERKNDRGIKESL